MNYFLAEGTTQRGPYNEQELAGAGVRPETLVWREGMLQWLPAAQVAELQPLLGVAWAQATGATHFVTPSYATPYATFPTASDVSGKKLAAGICGILLGTFGVHKFILGLTSGAVTMLSVSLGSLVLGFLTCGLTWLIPPVLHIIGLIEGIIYLSKSDAEFYQVYMVQKRQWF